MDTSSVHTVTVVAAAVILASLIGAACKRINVPALVGYLVLGFLFRLADTQWHFLNEHANAAFAFLAAIGLAVLLFTVGLKSNVAALLDKLPRASVLWVGNVGAAAGAGFVTAYYALGFDLVTALVVATALIATSVGVSLGAWEEADAVNSPNGETLLDVAELDDISGVALMALLFAVLPALFEESSGVAGIVAQQAGIFALKLGLFVAACVVFARLIEGRLVRVSARIEPRTGVMLIVMGIGLLIAAGAAWLGLSLAIGALFAGLVFSRDPEVERVEPAIVPLHAFFTPFFFIHVGLQVEPGALIQGAGLGAALLSAAVIGKLVGTALPAWWLTGGTGAVLIGISMIPRAEVAMIVMEQGRQLGPQVVPEPVFAAMVLVVIATSVLAPTVLRPLLGRWPQRSA